MVLMAASLLFAAGAGAKLRAAFFQDGDIGVVKTGPETSPADTDVTYTITVTTLGPDDIDSATLNDNLPSGMTFVSLDSSGAPGWSCSTPSVGTNGSIDCSHPLAPAD